MASVSWSVVSEIEAGQVSVKGKLVSSQLFRCERVGVSRQVSAGLSFSWSGVSWQESAGEVTAG